MFIFSRRTNFLSILLIFFVCFNVSKVKGSDFIFEHSIHLALKNSLELKAQNYRLAAAKHSLGEANSSKDWKNSFSTVFNSTNKDSNSNGFFGEDDTTTSTISISKNIFDGGEAFEKYSIAEDNLKLQRANLIKVKQKIILEAIKAYLDVYSNQSVVRLRKRSLKRFEENVEATKLKLEAGTVTPTVLAEAQSKYAKAKYELILAEGNLNNYISKLKSITKLKNVPSDLKLPKLYFKIPKTVNKAVEVSLENNPIILVAKLEKDIAKKNVDLKKSNNRPSLKMEFFGKDSQSSVNTSASDYQSYGANLTFSTPLFYNESTKDNIRRLDKLFIATSFDLSEKNRQVELNAISSYQNYKSTLAKTSASRSEKISSLLALNGIKKEAQFGIRTVLDVLDAEVEYLNASTNVIKSKADEIYSQFHIKSILGNLSIRDINRDYKVNHDLKENSLNFKILDPKAFN